MQIIKGIILFLFICFNISHVSAQIDKGHIQLEFYHSVGKSQLHLDSTFQNYFGETFSVHKFRYYISGIVFRDSLTGRAFAIDEKYFLINEANPSSKRLKFDIPGGQYNAVSFLIGVDSIRNTSGAQTGVLDPVNDMFWTWRSGYVMAKLEGKSPVSTLPHHLFEYHIGGFSGANNVLRTVNLALPGEKLGDARSGKNILITINVNLQAWFNAVHQLSIAAHAACTSPGLLAKQYSDNYQQMFSIQSVHIE